MNCKPGDLAVIVKSQYPENIGGLVRVISGDSMFDWKCRALSTLRNGYGICHVGEIGFAEDSDLRPIRDPGDDAKDETLDWLPVPTTEKEKECSTS